MTPRLLLCNEINGLNCPQTFPRGSQKLLPVTLTCWGAEAPVHPWEPQAERPTAGATQLWGASQACSSKTGTFPFPLAAVPSSWSRSEPGELPGPRLVSGASGSAWPCAAEVEGFLSLPLKGLFTSALPAAHHLVSLSSRRVQGTGMRNRWTENQLHSAHS